MKFVVQFPHDEKGCFKSGPVSVREWDGKETTAITSPGDVVVDGADGPNLASLAILLLIQSEQSQAAILSAVEQSMPMLGAFPNKQNRKH